MYSDDEIEIARKNAQIEDQNLRASFAAGDLAFSHSFNETLQEEIEDLQREVERLNTLLSSPLNVIAQKHRNFRIAYDDLRLKHSEWVLSQRAFKEIAMELGEKLGISQKEVQERGFQAKEVILTGTSKFGNELESGTWSNDFREQMMKDFREDQAKRAGIKSTD